MNFTNKTMPFQNRYHRRLVAETASKSCFICYKPSSTVLITPDNADFFYVCPGHLSDKGFAEPVQEPSSNSSEDDKEKKYSEDLEKEIEQVKKEYEEKVRKRKEKGKGKKKDGEDGKEEKTSVKPNDEDDVAANQEKKERDDKIKDLEQKAGGNTASSGQDNSNSGGSRIYVLHRHVHQMRVNRIQSAQAAKRQAERLRNPNLFPTVPNQNP